MTGCLRVLVWWVWRGIVPIRGAGETGYAVPSAKKTGNGGLQHPDISYLFCLICFPPSGLSFCIVNLVILLLP